MNRRKTSPSMRILAAILSVLMLGSVVVPLLIEMFN